MGMNTPPKRRRFTWNFPEQETPVGPFVSGLDNPEYSVRLASIIVEFNFLESHMPFVLSLLMGMENEQPAGYVYRAIRSANSRLEVMHELLHKSKDNENKEDEYDELLRHFNEVRIARNRYAHGLWFTHEETSQVYFSATDEHGFGFLASVEEPLCALDLLVNEIRMLAKRVLLMRADTMRARPETAGS
jgi:hypothetical protein